ncbi:hypothetical protein A3F37_04335 [Candidatus Saccharibacteria bacterium RIFCSPHIGHO2_12_FULL_41_12]|nr:MAG: hypothetical protein A3F37_04335 [Candidatus Saccharibacteria bacterium RIFCSPHIGHO2_12_FULL_41_12]
MNIVGHRGAAGLAPENTLKSIQVARDLGLDVIELDIRKTKDRKLVVCHDKDLRRIAGIDKRISQLTLAEIKKVKTISGEPIPTLQEAIKEAGNITLLIEGKGSGWAEILSDIIRNTEFKKPPKVISFNLKELSKFKNLCPKTDTIISDWHNPLKTIYFASESSTSGICVKFWVYHPLIYWLAKRNRLDQYVYTINNKFIAKIFHTLYPEVSIVTNRPDKLI